MVNFGSLAVKRFFRLDNIISNLDVLDIVLSNLVPGFYFL